MRMSVSLSALCVIVGLLAGPAVGQYRIEQGQVLDANLRAGSGGLNPARAPYDFQAANRIMTGNVPLGRGFQGYSPISNPRAFGLGSPMVSGGFTPGNLLPSDRLAGFYRDSYNLADYRAMQPVHTGLLGAGRVSGPSDFGAYYSPYSTVDTTGTILLSRGQVGTISPMNPYQVPVTDLPVSGLTVSPLADGMAQPAGPLAVPTRLIRAQSEQPVAGQVNRRLLNTPLFGTAFREVPVTEVAQQARQAEGLARIDSQAPPASLMGPLDVRLGRPERLTEGIARPAGPTGQPQQVRGQNLERVFQRAADEEALLAPQPRRATDSPTEPRITPEIQTPRLVVEPGEGVAAATGRPADIYSWMRGEIGDQPRLLRPTEPVEPEPPVQPGDSALAGESLIPPETPQAAPPVPETPPTAPTLDTFVGSEDSLLNRQMAYAEEALKQGRYYRAAEAYLIARTVDPDNPLPVLGRSMALLAAGDYLSSVVDLFEAIRLFGPLGSFRIDLKAFLPDVHAIDLRRADLERQLEVHEDARLRFLLGFAEYTSGLEEFGLANMEKAIAQGEHALRTGTAQPDDTRRPGVQTPLLEALEQFVQTLRTRVHGAEAPVPLPDSP